MLGSKGEEKTYTEPALTSRGARKFVWMLIDPGQGLHKSTIFGYVDGFVVNSYFECVLGILG